MNDIYLSVVIPVYNEEKRLEIGLNKILNYLHNHTHYHYEVIAVLNGCSDRSALIAERFKYNWLQFWYINLAARGKGLAIQQGMIKARGRYILMADIDFSMPPFEIIPLLEWAKLGKYGIISGKRRIKYNKPGRQLAHVIYKLMVRPFTRVNDPQTGFKLFTADCAYKIFNNDMYIKGWGFDIEVLLLAEIYGYLVKEIPVTWAPAEGSKIRIVRDGFRMALDLLRLFKWYGF